jgi:hypothetical protein
VGSYVYAPDSGFTNYAAYFLVIRSLATVIVTSVPPLIQAYKGNAYIPIPPNRENIE